MTKFMKGYKLQSLIAILFKFMEAVFELILPLLMVTLIDKGIVMKDQATVYRMVFLMLVLTVLGYIAAMICQYMASVISVRISGKIRLALFDKISTFTMREYAYFSGSTLANRMGTDVNAIMDMIARTIRLAVRAPMILVGSLFALYQLSPKLSITLLYFVPLFVIVIVFFMYVSMTSHKKAHAQLDDLSKKSRSLLEGSQIVRAFSREDYEAQLFKGLNSDLSKSQRKVGLIASLSNPFTTLLMNGVLVLLVYMGSLEINTGTMSQGQMVALINYCTQLVLTLIIFMNLVMVFSRGFVSTGRIKEILNFNVEQKDEGRVQLDNKPLSLSFDSVSFSYPNEDRKVIRDISFDIKEGQRVGFIGLTGSGKSSLARLMMRFYDVREGTIRLDGRNIKDYSIESLRSRIAYISQTPQFLPGTLSSNILMGDKGDVSDLLASAQGLDILSKGDNAPVLSRGRNYSGGQRQRISIARSLSKDFGLIIFDDSFSALDMLTSSALRDEMKTRYKGTTQIIISQRTQVLLDMDCIYVMDKGVLVDQGSHTDLLKTCDLYRQVHALQSEDLS